MEKDFYDRTVADGTIASLLSGRFYSQFKNDNEYPKMVYYFSKGKRVKSHKSVATGDMYKSMIQVDVFGRSRSDVKPVADQMEVLWDEYRNTTYGDTNFRRSELVRNDTDDAFPLDNSELAIYRQSIDFEIYWKQA